MTKVDFSVNHLSRFTYEPFLHMILSPSHDLVSLHTILYSGNVVFHGLKQKSRTENTFDEGKMASMIPTRARGRGTSIIPC